MAATIHLIQWRDTDAGTKGGSATAFSFLSADLAGDPALVDATCRVNNPLTVPSSGCIYSYSVHLSACINASPANYVKNFQVWGTFPAQAPPTGTCVLFITEACGAGTTPTDRLLATGDLNDATSDSKAAWDAASYAAPTCSTGYLVLQLQVANTACVGNWGTTGCSLSYSYDEA